MGDGGRSRSYVPGRPSPVIHPWNCPRGGRGFPIEMPPLHRVHSGRRTESVFGPLSSVRCSDLSQTGVITNGGKGWTLRVNTSCENAPLCEKSIGRGIVHQASEDFLLKCLLYTVSTRDGDGGQSRSSVPGRPSPVIHSWNCPPGGRGFPIEMHPLHRVHSGREMEDRKKRMLQYQGGKILWQLF